VTTAQVEADSGRLAAAKSRATAALVTAHRHGRKRYELESRLLLGVIELRRGHSAFGHTQLEGLAAESDTQGFHLLAQEANLALKP
jgi:hypothetical protein